MVTLLFDICVFYVHANNINNINNNK